MKSKLKPLRPSAKENKRYRVVKGKNLRENIEKAILDFGGVLGMSKTGLAFVELDSNSAIVAVNRQALNLVRASMAVFHEKIIVEKVSGTLKGLEK
jgi:RNase P/RNase MRP subunit POP5